MTRDAPKKVNRTLGWILDGGRATYQVQVYPWWLIQPDVQYIINPGAGLADPNRPNKCVSDAVVFGTRSIVTF